jgi:GTP-binding protein
MKRKPIIAIVGRPNVGKSTFVNRLVGSRSSIVDDMPGVTRDRIYLDAEWTGKPFTIIDTGGIIPGDEDFIMTSIFSQVEIAREEADMIIFLVDGIEGVTPVDIDVANLLRKSKKKLFVVVNKIDTFEKMPLVNDFYQLGLGDPYAVSAMHGSGGVGDLLDDIVKEFPAYATQEELQTIRVAIVGKPNAGKSSIVNALLGKERVIVSEVSGTTRDSIDTEIVVNGKKFKLIDTAGIRKKAKVDYGIESFAVTRAIRSIQDCDVAILLIDVTEGLTDQDKKIANIAQEAGKGLIIALNKWDLIENKDSNTINKYTNEIRHDAHFLDYAPLMFVSAVEKQRIFKIFDLVSEIYEQATKKVSTSLLNRVILEAFALNPPVSERGKRLKAFYSTQLGSQPPTFIVFVNHLELIKENYLRYLDKKLRDAFGFMGTPIKIVTRERKEK